MIEMYLVCVGFYKFINGVKTIVLKIYRSFKDVVK